MLAKRTELNEDNFVQARDILLSAHLLEGWKTRVALGLFEQTELAHSQHDSRSLDDLDDFLSTPWDFVDGRIVINEEAASTVSPFNDSINKEPGNSDRPRGLSYLDDRDILELIHPPHACDFPSVVKPPLSIHKDTPESLVACYMHPSMPQLCPHSLLNPSGSTIPHSSPPNVSFPAHKVSQMIDPTRWAQMKVAWLVPIRGTVPWPNTSSGWMLTDDAERSKSPFIKSREYTQPIMWTPTLLQGFWKHLIRHQKRNTLGPLAFSIIPAQGLLPDMIKVRCDATMTMKVRTLLSVFHLQPPAGDTKGLETHTAKSPAEERTLKEDSLITPLRRCRLVLLNDTGEPLLIS